MSIRFSNNFAGAGSFTQGSNSAVSVGNAPSLTFSGGTFDDPKEDGCGFDSDEIEQAPPVPIEDPDDDE